MIRVVRAFGAYGLFVAALVGALRRHGVPWGKVLEEAYNIGVRSLSVLLVINIFVGSNLAIQGYNAFLPLGGQSLVGLFVSLAGVRELAPILAAAMVAAKAGTEMASQLGVMRIREQIDALEVMAVNPYAWLIAPRLLGILLVMPALTIIALVTTLASGYAVSVWQLNLNGQAFLELAAQGIQGRDLLFAILKALLFGGIICSLSCWFGFHCERGPAGVGRATNQAVVASAVVCVVANYFISNLLYGGQSGL